MFDLIRILGSEHFFKTNDFLKKNHNQSASFIGKSQNIYIFTVQMTSCNLESYGIIRSKEKKAVGSPSKTNSYLGGEFKIVLDELFSIYGSKNKIPCRGTVDHFLLLKRHRAIVKISKDFHKNQGRLNKRKYSEELAKKVKEKIKKGERK